MNRSNLRNLGVLVLVIFIIPEKVLEVRYLHAVNIILVVVKNVGQQPVLITNHPENEEDEKSHYHEDGNEDQESDGHVPQRYLGPLWPNWKTRDRQEAND
ncbi:hypothetical protein PsorP6_002711 [Peronosclerospora sorghi]|uniref:Uncharacterized protein n=1 Tax=Peronosclerospora sorghi TaxID=230839 RepID=A0ACC0WZN8_9STRA|nr:hypothetical protein PsorP6_002711 [Peronosclerospora sorghi]